MRENRIDWTRFFKPVCLLCMVCGGLWPVSYTHLDVYKRQLQPRCPKKGGGAAKRGRAARQGQPDKKPSGAAAVCRQMCIRDSYWGLYRYLLLRCGYRYRH